MPSEHNYPKLHNAMWPGVVGKGSGDGEPFIPLDTLLTLTANARYDGQKFDGVDLWLADPHISIELDPRPGEARVRPHREFRAERRLLRRANLGRRRRRVGDGFGG